MLKTRRGDTLVEVLFAIVIFCLVSVLTVGLMNGGIYTAQKSLEVTMVRNEIDAQAEALRYIHNSYLAEREHAGQNRQFHKLWTTLTDSGIVMKPGQASWDTWVQSANNVRSCSELYDGNESTGLRRLYEYGAFVLNTRMIQPEKAGSIYGLGEEDDAILDYDSFYRDLLHQMIVGSKSDLVADYRLQPADLYPRIIYSQWGSPTEFDPNSATGHLKEEQMYRQIKEAQGLWIIAAASEETDSYSGQPEFYDFHIRSCWHSTGRLTPSTIGTIIRLYNPEIIEGEKR